jgi:hypothetical protein
MEDEVNKTEETKTGGEPSEKVQENVESPKEESTEEVPSPKSEAPKEPFLEEASKEDESETHSE